MRLIVFFDLPMRTSKELKSYTKFRKFLLKNGFMMLQESVYSKLVLNQTQSKLLTQKLKLNAPPSGLVQLLSITEKQFSKMEFIVGEKIQK